ncbi:MAG: hypothetical protein DK302_001235 [Chloroflexi bacterium]|jgi:hypothetical protein|nr:MAG: hypothetical protein DK302_001235 [Chloroflexota bacterium]
MTVILDANKGLVKKEHLGSNSVVLNDSSIELKRSSDYQESIIFSLADVVSTTVISEHRNFSNIFWFIISMLVGLIVWRLINNDVLAWLLSGIIWILSIYFFVDKTMLNRNSILVFNLSSNINYQVTLTGKQSKIDALSFVESIYKGKSLVETSRSNSDRRNTVKHKNRYSNQVYTLTN